MTTTIGPGIPCYYGCGPMQAVPSGNLVKRLACPTCGLEVLYNPQANTWLRIKEGNNP